MANLYKHQQELLDRGPDRHLIAWETGTGKTLVSLALAESKKAESVLIVCPKGLLTNWDRTVDAYDGPWHHSLIITKEQFRRDWDDIPKADCVIVDEAHTFAGRTSQMSKNLAKYLKKWNVPYRYMLTATPYLRDAWNIYVLADHLGHKMNWARFKETFFRDVYFGRRVVPVPRDGMEQELKKIVNIIGSTKRLDECIDVPKQTYETEYFSITKDQERAIKEIKDTTHITRWTKIHQIMGGSLKDDEFNPLQVFESQKLDRLKELAAENDRMIVVCRYRSEIEVLEEELETIRPGVEIMTGDTKNRQEILDRLNKKQQYILIVSAQLCEGWELADCPLMVFYSYSFSLKDKVQMEGRIRRINSLKPNTYLSLVVEKSIDEDVYECLKKKEDFHIELYKK